MNYIIQRIFLFAFLILIAISSVSGSYKVYVIHGYACPKFILKKIAKVLKAEHYNTENYGYKSMSNDLDSIGKQLYNDINKSGFDTVSFVTHSMGGLVVRSMLQYSIEDKNFPVVLRIVMIAPPNGGAEIADFYASFKILKRLLGPNVQHMKTDSDSYANKLPIPHNSEVGVIIGMRGKKHGYNPFIQGDNDGFLSPEKAKLGIEKDIAFVKHDHTSIIQNKDVCKLVVEFLKFGTFVSKEKTFN